MQPNTDNKYYEEAARKLEKYIGEHHLRHTQERYTILSYICEIGRPFTADQVIKMAEKDFISRPTVYNTLELLVSAQILWEGGKRGGKQEYEMLHGVKMRMRMRCTRCGRLSNFKDSAIEELIAKHKFRNFRLSHYTLEVWGTCRVCEVDEP